MAKALQLGALPLDAPCAARKARPRVAEAMDQQALKNPFVSKHDRESLLETRNRYDKLRDLIAGLSTKLSNVSSHIEDEFLSAYRVHMLSVQQELRDLKMQVLKAEEALNEDRQVATLEQEVTWFSDEATRLKNQSSSMKKDMQHIVARTNALREQRTFLGEQLKSTLKRSRILEAELRELTGNQFENENASVTTSIHSQSQKMHASASAPSLRRQQQLPASGTKSFSKLPNLNKSRQHLKPSASSASVMTIEDALIKPKPKMSSSDLQQHAVSTVEELEVLKASRADTEVDLEMAIRGVLREIIDRKITTAARDMRLSLEEVKLTKPRLNDMGGITGLGLEHFSDSDRLSAISIYLSQPNTFRGIVRYLAEEI